MLKREDCQEIGRPKNWDEETMGPCASVFVLPVQDRESGLTQMFSFYQPTLEELHELNKGGCIRLGIVGAAQHPVFNMTVISQEGTAEANFEKAWSMG